jgi:hypothetical protein
VCLNYDMILYVVCHTLKLVNCNVTMRKPGDPLEWHSPHQLDTWPFTCTHLLYCTQLATDMYIHIASTPH